jgi:hypothetical protein
VAHNQASGWKIFGGVGNRSERVAEGVEADAFAA